MKHSFISPANRFSEKASRPGRAAWLLLGAWLVLGLAHCGEKKEATGPTTAKTTKSTASGGGKEKLVQQGPIRILLTESGTDLELLFSAEDGFAIQNTNYNKLHYLQGEKKTALKLTGALRQDKPDYFQTIEPVVLKNWEKPSKGKLKGKLFFCNLAKNYCSQQKLNLEL